MLGSRGSVRISGHFEVHRAPQIVQINRVPNSQHFSDSHYDLSSHKSITQVATFIYNHSINPIGTKQRIKSTEHFNRIRSKAF